jgi:hypothetical protein
VTWWNNHCAFLDGDTDCSKRSGFLPLMPLPGRAGIELEIAANLHADETEDRALLARHGWRLVDPEAVAGTAMEFRRYVQESRGEVSAAKPAYVKARAGWISDRTVCYLASGRPCVVEATGVEGHVPASAGLRFFSTLDDAVEAVRAVEADYPGASRAARRPRRSSHPRRPARPAAAMRRVSALPIAPGWTRRRRPWWGPSTCTATTAPTHRAQRRCGAGAGRGRAAPGAVVPRHVYPTGPIAILMQKTVQRLRVLAASAATSRSAA